MAMFHGIGRDRYYVGTLLTMSVVMGPTSLTGTYSKSHWQRRRLLGVASGPFLSALYRPFVSREL